MQLLTKKYIDEIYEPLTYVENTASDYILTGVTPTVNTGIYVVYEYPSLDGSSAGITGTYIASGKGTLFISTASGSLGSTNLLSNHRGGSRNGGALAANTEYTAKVNWLNNGIIEINGYTVAQGTDDVNTTELRVFSRYNSGTGTWAYSHARVRKYLVSEDTTIIRDFVPVIRKSDNKPGMWDKVTRTFYTNAASTGNDFNYGE